MSLFKSPGKKSEFFALDVSSSSVKVLQLAFNGNDVSVEAFGRGGIDRAMLADKAVIDSEALGKAISAAVKAARVRGKRTFAAIPSSQASSKIIQIPAGMSELEQENYIQMEAGNHIPFPIEDVKLDFEVLNRKSVEGSVDVLLVAAKADSLQSRVEAIESAGIDVDVMDAEEFAVVRAMQYIIGMDRLKGVDDPIEVVIDLGHEFTTMNVIKGGESIYSREQSFGMKQLTDDIQRRLGKSAEVSLGMLTSGSLPAELSEGVVPQFRAETASQIGRLIQFFYAGTSFNRVHRIWLAGGGANLSGLREEVEQTTGVPTKIANPFKGARVGRNVDAAALNYAGPSLLTAFGLAMRHDQDGSHINLMPWRVARRQQLQKKFLTMLGMSAAAAAGVILLCFALLSGAMSRQETRIKFLDKAISQAEADIAEIKSLEERKNQMLARKNVIDRLQSERDQLAFIFNELSENSISGLLLTGMSHKNNMLEIYGVAESNSVVASFIKKLEGSGWFDKPEIVIISGEEGGKRVAKIEVPENFGYTFTVRSSLKNPHAAVVEIDLSGDVEPQTEEKTRLRDRVAERRKKVDVSAE